MAGFADMQDCVGIGQGEEESQMETGLHGTLFLKIMLLMLLLFCLFGNLYMSKLARV